MLPYNQKEPKQLPKEVLVKWLWGKMVGESFNIIPLHAGQACRAFNPLTFDNFPEFSARS